MSREMAHKVILPPKKIISRSFLNSGTLIVIIFSAPLCPTPPLPPTDGSVVNNPLILGSVVGEVCGVNSQQTSMKCPSFLNIYIQSATIGRDPAQGKILCNGTSGKYIFTITVQVIYH